MPSSTSVSSRVLFGSELDYKNKLIQLLRERGAHVQRHEDRHENYVPDLSFGLHDVDFWMEVKYCKIPPIKLSSIDHYTVGQRDWLTQRAKTGAGFCFLLLGLPGCELLLEAPILKSVHDAPLSMALGAGIVCRDLLHVVDRLVWIADT